MIQFGKVKHNRYLISCAGMILGWMQVLCNRFHLMVAANQSVTLSVAEAFLASFTFNWIWAFLQTLSWVEHNSLLKRHGWFPIWDIVHWVGNSDFLLFHWKVSVACSVASSQVGGARSLVSLALWSLKMGHFPWVGACFLSFIFKQYSYARFQQWCLIRIFLLS